jgi:hypothetical protein
MDQREIALLMDSEVTDAVALLENHGYSRAIGAIVLSSDDRQNAVARIRDERQRRASEWPLLSRKAVRDDVVASERIEGIDVRQWI